MAQIDSKSRGSQRRIMNAQPPGLESQDSRCRPTDSRRSCGDSKCLLPGEAAGGWGPGLKELAKKDDAAEVIGVVGGERDELVAHGHDAGGSAGPGWTADGMIEALGVLGGSGGLLGSVKEAVAELLPWFC